MEPIEALKRGEPEAITWLVDSFAQRLLKSATLLLGDEHLAEDAVQDCLVDAISHLSNFRGEASIYTWLYAILLRRCRRMRRSLTVRIEQSLTDDNVEPLLFRSGNYRSMPPVEGRLQVREAIRSLVFKYREVIVLFYYEGFSIKEMADLLGVPEGTVKNRLHRARKQLRDLLAESEGELCQERLDAELQDVAFSTEQQQLLKARLLLAGQKQRSRRFLGRLKEFWHGTTEIPLPVAAAAALLLGVGLCSAFMSVYMVDVSTAAVLLQLGVDSFRTISQGVSVL